MALIATGAVVVALLLVWLPGRARVREFCGVCGSSRDSTAIGLFWEDHPVAAFSFGDHESPSPSFTDTFAVRGHVHRWESERYVPERFVADLFVRRIVCPRTPHCFHSELALEFNTSPEFRSRLAALIQRKTWTLAEVEDALLWCDDLGCPFSWHDLPQEVADRRANANARLQPLLKEFAAHAR